MSDSIHNSTLPFFIRFGQDEVILLVGGGAVAMGKAGVLLSTSARIRVVAKSFSPLFLELLKKRSHLELIEGPYLKSHLDGVRFVVAATNCRQTNVTIREDAHAVGAIVNVVDDPELCDGFFPAIVSRNMV